MNKIVAAGVLLLAGCSSVPGTINPENVATSELANIATLRYEATFPGAVSTDYSARIEGIFDEGGKAVFETGLTRQALEEVNLPAGKYTIAAVCANHFGFAHTKVSAELKPSKKYRLRCSIYTGKNIFGMKVDSRAEAVLDDLEKTEAEAPHWP
jgi:uncharacterized protein YceK